MSTKRCNWLMSGAFAAGIAMATGPAFAIDIAHFENDGNLFATPTATILDWADGTIGGGDFCIIDERPYLGALACPGDPDGVHIIDEVKMDSTGYVTGSKIEPISTQTFGLKNMPAANDLVNVYLWKSINGGDTYVHGGFELHSGNGANYAGFEFLRAVDAEGKPINASTGLPGRSPGDLLIRYERCSLTGGTPKCVGLIGYEADASGILQLIFDIQVTLDSALSLAALGNGTDISGSLPGSLCGGACPAGTAIISMAVTDIPAGPWGTDQKFRDPDTIENFNFAEFSLNLDEIGRGPSCPGSAFALVNTSASREFISDMKDRTETVPFDLNTCAKVTIKKETIGGFGTFGFSSGGLTDFTATPDTNVSGDNFTLTTASGTNPDQIVFSLVDPADGPFTVTETTLPSGWSLLNPGGIVCNVDNDGGDSSDDTTFSIDLSAKDVDIGLAVNEEVTCLFKNEALGKIIIQKSVTAPTGTTVPAFDYDVPDALNTSDVMVQTSLGASLPGSSCTDETSPGSDCLLFDDLSPGTYSITELAEANWEFLPMVSCTEGDSSSGNNTTVSGTTANANLQAGETIVCTWTNTHQTLKVNKVVDNTCDNDDGVFTLMVAGSSGSTTDFSGAVGPVGGGTSGMDAGMIGPNFVLRDTYTVSETVGGGATAADYVTTINSGDCDSSGSVTVAAGDADSCTITNVRKARLTIVKKLVSGIGTFDLLLNGSTVRAWSGDGGVGIYPDLTTCQAGELDDSSCVPNPAFVGGDDPVGVGNNGTVTYRLPPGVTYSVGEQGNTANLAGFFTNITCNNTAATNATFAPNAGDPRSTASFLLNSGEEVTCTIYNTSVEQAGACPDPG